MLDGDIMLNYEKPKQRQHDFLASQNYGSGLDCFVAGIL